MLKHWMPMLCLGLYAGGSWAGLEIVSENRLMMSGMPEQVHETRMYLGDDRLAIRTKDGRQSMGPDRIVYRGDKEEMWMVYDGQRRYQVMDRAAMSALAEQLNAAQRQVEEALARVPAEQREMMRGMMQKQMPAKKAADRTVTRTSERREISGYPCVKYDVHSDGKLMSELWVASWNDLGHRESSFGAIKKMAGFQKEMMETMSQGPLGAAASDPFMDFDEVDGFPISVRYFENGRPAGEMTIRSITGKDVGAEEFDVPAGYRAEPLIPSGAPRF